MKSTINGAKWSTEINTDVCDVYNNADLTIILKVGFRKIDPAGGAASGTYHDYGDATEPTRKIIKWTPGAWNYWKESFIKSAQSFWNGKFWLINNFNVGTYKVKGVEFRPNLYCKFILREVWTPGPGEAGPSEANHTIDVVRLDPTETWFGSHSTLYDSNDSRLTQKNVDSKGKPVMQRAHVHEIGHLLGLQHVDVGKAHCPSAGNTNAAACYGISDVDMRSVMGSGMAIRLSNADPWREAAILHFKVGSLGTAGDWQAKVERHYPRTTAEANANRLVTARRAA